MTQFEDYKPQLSEIPTWRIVAYCAVLYIVTCIFAAGCTHSPQTLNSVALPDSTRDEIWIRSGSVWVWVGDSDDGGPYVTGTHQVNPEVKLAEDEEGQYRARYPRKQK